MRDQVRPEAMQADAQRATAAAANHHRRAEDASRPATANREARGDDLAQSDSQENRGKEETGLALVVGQHGLLEDAVAEREYREHLLFPAKEVVESHTQQAAQAAT